MTWPPSKKGFAVRPIWINAWRSLKINLNGIARTAQRNGQRI
jgi:hypothetical protein